MAHYRPSETLNPTALVHEAYLRLVGDGNDRRFHDRGHFFAAAATAMRHIRIDQARRKKTQKRGGNLQRLELDDLAAPAPDDELLALDEALDTLARLSPRQAQMVEGRFFGGLEIPEIAEWLGVSEATVLRDWRASKAWLARELRRDRPAIRA